MVHSMQIISHYYFYVGFNELRKLRGGRTRRCRNYYYYFRTDGRKNFVSNIKMDEDSDFKFKYDFKEKSIPAEDQYLYTQEYADRLDETVDKITLLIEEIPFENIDVNYIQEYLSDNGIDHFIDPSFPPDDTSIWNVAEKETYPLNEKPIWKRPKDFMSGKPKLFEDGIDPNDIIQGELGDCWFIASIASLAEYPPLVKRLFITQSYNECGFYKLRICKDGEWVEVIVDDYIPCYLNGSPMYTNSQGNEIWVLLLEKAYAKLHGNYCALIDGNVKHGMCDLTGCPIVYEKFPENRNNYEQIEDYAEDLWK